MASILKKGGSWEAQVARQGIRKSASFPTKAMATAWATQIEAEIMAGKYKLVVKGKTFGQLVDAYLDANSDKAGHRWEKLRLELFKREYIDKDTILDRIDMKDWLAKRSKDVSALSVIREWTLLSHMFNYAIKPLNWMTVNPLKDIKRPEAPPPRTRRVHQEDVDKIIYALGYPDKPDTITHRVAVAFLFSIETGMRAGEVANLDWVNDHGGYVHLPKTKNGHPRDVPLTAKARELLDSMKANGTELCFNLTTSQIDSLFRKAKKMVGITDLHWHDTRREALTRLASTFKNPMDLAKVSGHRDLRILLNTYYGPTPGVLVRLLADGSGPST